MSRISSLDGLRGWFLITMTLSHLVLRQEHWVSKIHFRHVMFVESAQGFIFISGLLFGMVQFRRLETRGLPFVWRSSARRAMILWVTTVSLTLALMICRDVLPFGLEAFRNWLGTTGLHDPTRVAAILTLAFQPTFLDILPQYILYLLAAPALLVLIRKGWWPVAAAITAIWWMVSQLGLMLPVSRAVNRVFATSDGQGLRMAFDPMGWQLLFMSGVILGALWVRGDITTDRIFPKDRAWAVAAVAVLLFFAPLRIATANGWLDGDTISSFVMMEKRADFGPVYLLNFIAAAWLIGWLLARGGEMRSPALNIAAGLLQKLVALRPIVCLGRHSLLTYVWHVLLIYTLHYLDRAVVPLEGSPSNYAIVVLFALLFVPALIAEQRAPRPLVTARP
ncbi:OpgC domain-containing protein [Falsirhodobacter sp. 20TX0035]|uniref:OpgC domain-containing protein n=1 Tax=Falsirhodobacter sp. 20TX0035 TaxID=3022019 RepID=UPI00232B7315|nr:OpgC domain-containing protein [Falsirhodobacter sp. 20TX0035]MDB6453100.1 OpgC domain-containing protein [Falsirhodobacter sp. 20TX0035]